jgi:hypothetical protein
MHELPDLTRGGTNTCRSGALSALLTGGSLFGQEWLTQPRALMGDVDGRVENETEAT